MVLEEHDVSPDGRFAVGVRRFIRGDRYRSHLWLVPLAGGGAYQNFVDPSLADWQQAYYGLNLARLRAIKAKVDPDFFFRFAQAIPPG